MLYSAGPCPRCGADVWRLGSLRHDTSARVIDLSCFYCGTSLYGNSCADADATPRERRVVSVAL